MRIIVTLRETARTPGGRAGQLFDRFAVLEPCKTEIKRYSNA